MRGLSKHGWCPSELHWSSNNTIPGAKELQMVVSTLMWSGDGAILGNGIDPFIFDIGPHVVLAQLQFASSCHSLMAGSDNLLLL